MKQHILTYTILLHFAFRPGIALAGEKVRLQVILDASVSMSKEWKGNESKFAGASIFIAALTDSAYAVDSSLEMGLRVFGHQYTPIQGNCFDTKQEVLFTKDNREQMKMRLASIRPRGTGSVTYSLQEALKSKDAKDGYEYHYIIITDGGEGCNSDLCSVLDKHKISTYIVQMSGERSAQFRCVENYINLNSKEQFATTITSILNPFRKRRALNAVAVVKEVKPSIDTSMGFGYLLISDIKNAEINTLLYKEGEAYIPFTRLNIANLTKGQRIMMKKGFYKIEYKAAFIARRIKEFEIKSNMITEIIIK